MKHDFDLNIDLLRSSLSSMKIKDNLKDNDLRTIDLVKKTRTMRSKGYVIAFVLVFDLHFVQPYFGGYL